MSTKEAAMNNVPATPRHKRLVVTDAHGNRASSTPPASRVTNPHLLAPMAAISPFSRHSSPGIDRLWTGRHYPDDLIPRRLTASPVARIKDRDKTRGRLAQYHSIDHAVDLLKKAKRIVVLTGAGISTSLDIPDFRSAEGFYSKLSSSIGITTPEEFFSLEFFNRQHESFWKNVKPLLPRYARDKKGGYQTFSKSTDSNQSDAVPRFSKTHAFLTLLQSKDKLLTNYTQNIDGLEYAAGVNAKKIIQCHGSWDTATCLTCGKTISAKKYLPIVYEEGYPRCKCATDDLAKGRTTSQKKKPTKKRKRPVYEGDSDHDSDDGTAIPRGLYKPDITFFGEPIPEYYVPRLEEDKVKADLLLVIGTSLKVRPVKTMLVEFPPHIPQIWINRDRFNGTYIDMPGVHVDVELLGECDLVVEELCCRAGFRLDDFTWKGPSIAENKENEHVTVAVRGKEGSSKTETPGKSEADEQKDNNLSSRRFSVPFAAPTAASATQKAQGLLPKSLPNEKLESTSGQPPAKAADTESTAKPASPGKRTLPRKPQRSAVRIENDLDAEWRWRFIRKPTTFDGSIKG